MLMLKELRMQKGLTIPALSKLSGVPIRTIEDAQRRGDCRISTAKRLAAALEVSLDEVYTIDDEPLN